MFLMVFASKSNFCYERYLTHRPSASLLFTDTEVHSRPLKRSASLASLPTPPRTHHKRSRSKAVSATSGHASEDSGSAKRRRTTDVLPAHDEEEDDENSFWTGRSVEDTEEDKSPSPALLKYRVREPCFATSLPQSTPSPTSCIISAALAFTPACTFLPKPPVTPPRKLFLRALPSPSNSKAKKIWPTRDSPDNPFLAGEGEASVSKASGWDSSDDELPIGEAPERESTPTPAPVFEEKPTITYVFRGQKATFHNPQYHLAPEVLEASKLPIDHPDFEVAEACAPRRLFSDKLKRKPHASASEGERNGTEREPVFSKPQGPDKGAERHELLQHAREERERRETDSKQRLASKDGLRAGAVCCGEGQSCSAGNGPLRITHPSDPLIRSFKLTASTNQSLH
ncbi:hypothetical protein DFJ58DRAFT_908766 [Suillus subalutaceus]|uniref:uncharacterized protein n=1 Tax=Suillus subalutaceus TaxID=48586 RepID=UPI001B8646EA|nr:uncharacterized protein DFJ58DRAFT_908766 [Suillus subalutaceus]KAG1832325.1 hypothetical protein DFJ58DRAFT_908766 [Suillus subalutaceus]